MIAYPPRACFYCGMDFMPYGQNDKYCNRYCKQLQKGKEQAERWVNKDPKKRDAAAMKRAHTWNNGGWLSKINGVRI